MFKNLMRFFYTFLFLLIGWSASAQFEVLIDNLKETYHTYYHNDFLYFSESEIGEVSRIDLNAPVPASTKELIVDNLMEPYGMVIIGTDLYVATTNGIVKKDLVNTATGAEDYLILNERIYSLTANDTDLYYSNFSNHTIAKVSTLDATPAPIEMVADVHLALELTIIEGVLYFLENDSGYVGKIDLPNIGGTPEIIFTGVDFCTALEFVGSTMYVNETFDNRLFLVDMSTNTIDTINFEGLLLHEMTASGSHLYLSKVDRILSKSLGISNTEDLHLKSDKMVYPNPISETLIIKGLKGREEIIIYDVLGNQVMQTSLFNHSELNLSQLAKGVYFIQFSDGTSKKILKQAH